MILGLCSFILYLIFWEDGFSWFHIVIFIFVRTIKDLKCCGHYYCCYNVTWRKSEEKTLNSFLFFFHPNLTLANWSLRRVWWRSCQGRYPSHIRLRFCFFSLSLSLFFFRPLLFPPLIVFCLSLSWDFAKKITWHAKATFEYRSLLIERNFGVVCLYIFIRLDTK